jgi:hypothetical protein
MGVGILLGLAFGGALGYFFVGPILMVFAFEPLQQLAAGVGLRLEAEHVRWLGAVVTALLAAVIGRPHRAVSTGGADRALKETELLAAARAAREAAEPASALDTELLEKLTRHFGGDASVLVRNTVSAEVLGLRLLAGDITRSRDSGERSSTNTQTVVFHEDTRLRFPSFYLQPEGPLLNLFYRLSGYADIDFGSHPAFSRAYHLTGRYEEDLRKLFNTRLLAELERRPGLTVQAAGAALILFRTNVICAGAERDRLVAEAAEIFRLIAESARASGFSANRVVNRDVRALVGKLPGLGGIDARRELVTRADLEAFLHCAPPRKLPANIRLYMERIVPQVFPGFGLIFAMAGTLFTYMFTRQAIERGAGFFTGDTGGALMGLLFLAIGAPVAFFGGRARHRIKRVLKRGKLTPATIEKVQPTGTSVNGVAQYELTVRYRADGREVRGSGKVAGAGVERAQKYAAEHKPAAILYDPANPGQVLLADGLLTTTLEDEA